MTADRCDTQASDASKAAVAWGLCKPQDAVDRYQLWCEKGLLQRGAKVHDAAAVNEVRTLQALLTSSPSPIDVDDRSTAGETALHHAASLGSLDCALVLLSSGWDPTARTYAGLTPLEYCFTRHPRDELNSSEEPVEKWESHAWHYNRVAMIMLLLLYGAVPQSEQFRQGQERLLRLLSAWDAVRACLQPANCQDRKEAVFLRNWSVCVEELKTALGSDFDHLGLCTCCSLLRLVLEARVAVSVVWSVGHSFAMNPMEGTYRYKSQRHGSLSYEQEQGECIFVRRNNCWLLCRGSEDSEEVLFHSGLGEVPDFTVKVAELPFQAYSSATFLPPVTPCDPNSDDLPFVGLLNPRSGNRMGALILEEAARFPMYRPRMFDVVQVVTVPAVGAAFQRQLYKCIDEAKRKSAGSRPRLICGGGDGTASLALCCVLKALCSKLGGLPLSDDELERFFPSLVQMPLGTGNDLAGVLGWGRTVNPIDNRDGLREWFCNAISHQRPLCPFDVWGLCPGKSASMKVCALAGLDPQHPDRPMFQESGAGVPFLCLLYFSMGFDAFVAAKVELNRTESRLMNFVEYGKQITSGMLGPQRRNIDLTGIVISVPGDPQPTQYFPPPESTHTCSEYESVGFMNINSLGGGCWSASPPASFKDGKLDLFRQRNYTGNLAKRGFRFETEKHRSATFSVPSELPGVHCQYDGEARFIFSPDSAKLDLVVQRVLQIPVAIGPEIMEFATGSSAGWLEWPERYAMGATAAFIPATSLDECKQLCIRHRFGGFCVTEGNAYFRHELGEALKQAAVKQKGSTLYIRDEAAQDIKFSFIGTIEEQLEFKQRLDSWATGELSKKLGASSSEINDLQIRAHRFSQGVCERARRNFANLRFDLGINACAACGTMCRNKGCKGCLRTFCDTCGAKHQGTAPLVKWMFADAGLAKDVARLNFMRWSTELSLHDAIQDIEQQDVRPICLRVFVQGKQVTEETLSDPAVAAVWIHELVERDKQDNPAE